MFSEKDLKDLNDYIELVKDLPFVHEFTEFKDYIKNIDIDPSIKFDNEKLIFEDKNIL